MLSFIMCICCVRNLLLDYVYVDNINDRFSRYVANTNDRAESRGRPEVFEEVAELQLRLRQIAGVT